VVRTEYGVLHFSNQNGNMLNVSGFEEKPEIPYVVSMGVYVLEPAALDYIEQGTYLDLPDLVLRLLAEGDVVMVEPYLAGTSARAVAEALGGTPSTQRRVAASEDLSELVRYEIALAKAEIKDDVRRGATAGGMVSVALFLVLMSTVTLVIAAGFGLVAAGFSAWAAFLIVSGGLIVLALLMVFVAFRLVKRIKPPERAIRLNILEKMKIKVS